MASIGQILRSERERRGVTLADVHSATKITPQNLEALEAENFGAFPNKVYTRAFLRDYANFLGLDSGPLLEMYEELYGSAQKDTTVVEQRPSNGGTGVVLGIAIAIILVVVGLAFYKPISTSKPPFTYHAGAYSP